MRGSIFNLVGNLDTLLAVILGAILATGGSFLAEVLQDRRGRKHKERDTARFIGEILTSIDQLIDLACQSQAVGDPWGPVTIRLFDSALREAAVYERNRERLFDIRDMELRMRIHAHVLSETIPIMAILEQSRQLLDLDERISRGKEANMETATQKADIDRTRQVSLESVRSQRANTEVLLEALSKIAKVSIKSKFEASYSADGLARWQPKADD